MEEEFINMANIEQATKLWRVKKAAQAATEEKAAAYAKDKLSKSLQTKFKTTMIGALAKFEKAFGDLWGAGKSDRELTREERENKEQWQAVRTEILDNGNSQLRYAMDELNRYDVNYKGYNLQMRVK